MREEALLSAELVLALVASSLWTMHMHTPNDFFSSDWEVSTGFFGIHPRQSEPLGGQRVDVVGLALWAKDVS